MPAKRTTTKQTSKRTASKKKAVEQLTGEALLQTIDRMSGANKEEIAKACGYVTQTKNGQERINLMQFYNAVLAAKAIDLDASGPGNGHRGRALSYRASVQKNGNLIIGAGYTQQLELHPGDEFEIKLGRKRIQLQKVD
jgi:hypothetical protein